MRINNIRAKVGEYFDYRIPANVADIFEDIISRVDNYSDEEDIRSAIDDGLIYTFDQWEIMKYYCTPQTANLCDAVEAFEWDVLNICSNIAEELGND